MILILLNRLVRSNNPRKFETNSSPNSVFRIVCLETQNVRSFDIPWVAERTAHAKSRKVLPESVQICVTIPKAPRGVVPLSLKRPGEASPRSLELLRFYKKGTPQWHAHKNGTTSQTHPLCTSKFQHGARVLGKTMPRHALPLYNTTKNTNGTRIRAALWRPVPFLLPSKGLVALSECKRKRCCFFARDMACPGV